MKYKKYLPNSEEYHLLHYLILFLGLSVFLICFRFFVYQEDYQIVIAALGSMFYSIWGVLHHAYEGRLTKLVVLEYVLFGLLSFLILVVLITL